MSIDIRNISKSFDGKRVLQEMSLRIEDGELVALLGPSGSGKTTLLRILAGLEQADTGVIAFHEEDVSSRPVNQRRVGFVFQHYALFRHMTIFENVAFGLRVRPRALRPTRQEIQKRVDHLLDMVQLQGMSRRYPHQLSGGQRQRVALARALAVEPRILLLDEPFGALDARVRLELRRWLRHLHDELGVTSVLVTHDQDEALEVADRVVVMNQGRIEQIGTPDEVFHKPANKFVLQFLGQVNRFHGRPDLLFDARQQPHLDATETEWFVRPFDLELLDADDPRSGIPAIIDRLQSAGSTVRIELTTQEGRQALVELPHSESRARNLNPGQPVRLHARSRHVFPEDYVI